PASPKCDGFHHSSYLLLFTILELLNGILRRDLAAFKPREDVRLIVGRRNLHKFQLARDPTQSALDGGIADAEILFHFSDRAVRTDESRHENLVIKSQFRQSRQFELPFDSNSGFGQSNAFDYKVLSLGQGGEMFPVLSHASQSSLE